MNEEVSAQLFAAQHRKNDRLLDGLNAVEIRGVGCVLHVHTRTWLGVRGYLVNRLPNGLQSHDFRPKSGAFYRGETPPASTQICESCSGAPYGGRILSRVQQPRVQQMTFVRQAKTYDVCIVGSGAGG